MNNSNVIKKTFIELLILLIEKLIVYGLTNQLREKPRNEHGKGQR